MVPSEKSLVLLLWGGGQSKATLRNVVKYQPCSMLDRWRRSLNISPSKEDKLTARKIPKTIVPVTIASAAVFQVTSWPKTENDSGPR